jgi:hypothetical protein
MQLPKHTTKKRPASFGPCACKHIQLQPAAERIHRWARNEYQLPAKNVNIAQAGVIQLATLYNLVATLKDHLSSDKLTSSAGQYTPAASGPQKPNMSQRRQNCRDPSCITIFNLKDQP